MDSKMIFIEGDNSLIPFAENCIKNQVRAEQIPKIQRPIAQGGWNYSLNEALGKRQKPKATDQLILNQILNELKLIPSVGSITLFRGIKEKTPLAIGEEFVDLGIVSKSINPETSITYAYGGTLFLCHYPKASKQLFLGRGIGEIVSFPGEIFIVKMKATMGKIMVCFAEYFGNVHSTQKLELNPIVETRNYDKLLNEKILVIKTEKEVKCYIGIENSLSDLLPAVASTEFQADLLKVKNAQVYVVEIPKEKEMTYKRFGEKKPMAGSLFAYIRDTFLEKIEDRMKSEEIIFEIL